MNSDLEKRIIEQLGELDRRLGELVKAPDGPGGRRLALLALDRKLAAMAAAIDSEA